MRRLFHADCIQNAPPVHGIRVEFHVTNEKLHINFGRRLVSETAGFKPLRPAEHARFTDAETLRSLSST